jgi:outer membrane protein assembly factor BamB
MSSFYRTLGCTTVILNVLVAYPTASSGEMAARAAPASAGLLPNIGIERGICVVLGLPNQAGSGYVVDLARRSQLTIFFQSARTAEVAAVRQATANAGLLGTRVFADQGPARTIHLADNLAGAVLVADTAEGEVIESELLRVLHPEGVALAGKRRLVKPHPAGVDSWSHVFHRADNNPQSTDQSARAPYLTQFLADPKFCPMPEVSVAAGGRVFRAFGHIAHKANQNALLNTLLGINGYNGTILWQRPLREGFMIHRNTMVATPDFLYLADDESCKLLDARTGQLKGEIRLPEGSADGPVWKWLALEDGVLYALLGGQEVRPRTQRSEVMGLGHWPWGMWEGHEYKNPATNFGFGRTFVAIDPASRKVLWTARQEEPVDARGVCMKGGRLYFYSPGKSLICLNAASGQLAWRNSDRDLLEAIGVDGPAQHYITGYATTTFIKCNERYLFFAGPQRRRLVAASTENGKLLWHKEPGNLQLVLRGDVMYCAGPQRTIGFKLACATGEQLAELPARRACTRATGTIDSVFFRAHGGTVRIDVAGDKARHIAPMRPPCQDGVIISDGLLYWGPWMCGCELSFYGHICLGPAGKFNFQPRIQDARFVAAEGDPTTVQPFDSYPGDWPAYLANNARTGATEAQIPRRVSRRWAYRLPGGVRPTAPISVGGTVFLGDDSGIVHALDANDGSVRWRAFTGGAIFFPPALGQGRLFIGSADGRVQALEAATGRRLWSFRAAPANRWIPVYGKLMSTWPVAGGVALSDGIVYAAAGIAHYDGTYVYALDAATGAVKWCNASSGRLSQQVDCGISLQGDLRLVDGELRFLGGGKHEFGRYDLKTGQCLNLPDHSLASQYRTAFYPYYPDYGRYLSLAHLLPDGKELLYDASYEGSQHSALTLLRSLPPGAQRPVKQEARWPLAPRGGPKRSVVWAEKSGRRFNAFVVSPGTLLAAGESGVGTAKSAFLAAMHTATGSDTWYEALPAAAVRGGIAVDHQGRIAVALENGEVLEFSGP